MAGARESLSAADPASVIDSASWLEPLNDNVSELQLFLELSLLTSATGARLAFSRFLGGGHRFGVEDGGVSDVFVCHVNDTDITNKDIVISCISTAKHPRSALLVYRLELIIPRASRILSMDAFPPNPAPCEGNVKRFRTTRDYLHLV